MDKNRMNKVLICCFLFFGLFNQAKGQRLYEDSMVYVSATVALTVRPVRRGEIYYGRTMERLFFDSATSRGEYYHINGVRSKAAYFFLGDSVIKRYYLRYFDNKLYLSGTIGLDEYRISQDSEFCIFDFGASVGDTVRFISHDSFYHYELRVDSVKSEIFPDGIARDRYFSTFIGGSREIESYQHQMRSFIRGIGGFLGILPFPVDVGWESPRKSLYSACSNKELVYIDSSGGLLYGVGKRRLDPCDADSIMYYANFLNLQRQAFFETKVYPNPFSNHFQIDIVNRHFKGKIKVISSTGKEMYTDGLDTSKDVSTNRWPSGIYCLLIEDLSGKIRFKSRLVKL